MDSQHPPASSSSLDGPDEPLTHSGFMRLAFEHRDDGGAWVINPGARSVVYTGPLLTTKGTEAGTTSCTHSIKTVEVPLPPIWLLLRTLVETGNTYHQPPPLQFAPGSAPASPVPELPAPIVLVGGEDNDNDVMVEEDPIEEDPVKDDDEGVEYYPLDDDDAVDPIVDVDVGGGSPDSSPDRDDHGGLPNGFH